MVKVRGRNSNGKTVKQTVKNGRKISGDDAARPAWVMVPGVSSSRLRPDSDQSRVWCRARPWLGCDSLNELTWVSFVVHWHLTIFLFLFFLFSRLKGFFFHKRFRTEEEISIKIYIFFIRFVSVVWQDSDRVQSVTQVGPAKKGSQNLNLKLLEMLAISQFKARFQARNQF